MLYSIIRCFKPVLTAGQPLRPYERSIRRNEARNVRVGSKT